MKNEQIKDVDVAYNGFEGYNKAMVKEYDFIICDLNMPVMDGFECVKKIIEHYSSSNSFF